MNMNPVREHDDSQCKQTSIVCRIRNRNEIFADSIKNWLRFPVAEMIIVDFRDDGCQAVWDVVKKQNDPRIKVIETKYEYMFAPGIAWNLGMSQAKSEYLLLLDVDNILREHFFETHLLNEQEFVCGRSIKHLWGSCFCKKDYIDTVNGFNENCLYMGYADTDLYDRLVAAGYSKRTFVAGTIHHKNHPKKLTIESQIRQNNGDAPKIWQHMERFNEMLSRELLWTPASPKIHWSLESLEQGRWQAIRDVYKESEVRRKE
jgi:GT2 family glycosyltransferase